MTSSSRGKRRTTACRAGLVLLLSLPSLLFGQTVDSASSSASPRPNPAPITLDRYTIDVVALVRDGTARTISDVLISQIPGLLVIPGSGLNGGGASVRFAGVRSLAADVPPLVFLDGMRIDAREDDSQLLSGGPGPSRLDDIPVEDVQVIEVLRGPVSAALYGPGSAAGVILIHTKEGQSGDVRISGFAQGALRELPSRWPANYGAVDADNPNVFMQNGGCTLATQAAGGCVQDFIRSFNPLVERNPFTSAPHRQLGLSASGGPRWGTFRVSGSLDGDAAVYSVPAVTWADDYRQWNLRANTTVQPTEIVDVAASVARMSSTLRLPMYQPVRRALTGSSDSTGFSWAPFDDPGTQDLDRTQLAFGVHVRPQPWLALHAAFGRDNVDEHEMQVIPGQFRTTGQRSGRDQTVAFGATASNIAWRGMHLTTAVGVEKLELRDETRLMQIRPDTATSCGPSGPFPCSFTSQRILREVNSLGLYAMQRVAIGERLVVTGTLRHDDFAHFDAWSATHPSLSVDWIARSDRPGTLGRVALRAAYGSAAPPLPDIPPTYFVGPALPPAAPVKPDAAREFEFSAEAAGLGGRWRAQGAVYDLRTKGLQLVPVGSVPFFSRYAHVPGAELSNRGISATIWASVVDRASLAWDVRLSLWGNRNRLTKQRVPPFFYWGGTPTGQGSFEGFPANGYWSRPARFVDANGDGIIATSELIAPNGIEWAGTPYPTQGAQLTSSWRLLRHWRVTATVDYRAGQTLFNQIANSRCMFQRCRERFDPATAPADQANALAASQLPLAYFEDADYLKLREVAIAFDVPERIASTLGARAATIMLGGRDLATWTRYTGADPESGSYGQHEVAQPVLIGDFATVPVPRTWMLRIRMAY
ncbi:MAG TPA: TonB-dependent receptor [Gemmatimonadales bacterium]|nr:TonB-dependent receptor [Gemmatimonadales bacterium]